MSLRAKILKNKLSPIVFLSLNIYFFFFVIPEHAAHSFFVLLAIVGGVLTLMGTIWFFGSTAPKIILDSYPIFVGLLSVSTFFIFGYFFVVKTADFEYHQLMKDGVYTTAVVTDKTKIYGKSGSIQSIHVRFVTENNA